MQITLVDLGLYLIDRFLQNATSLVYIFFQVQATGDLFRFDPGWGYVVHQRRRSIRVYCKRLLYSRESRYKEHLK